MSGSAIAAEIAAALAEVGAEVGVGAYVCTIRRKSGVATEPQTGWAEPASPSNEPTLYAVNGVERIRDVRDMSGTLINVKRRTLTIDAVTIEPLTSDVIAVGVAPADVTAATKFEEILSVSALSPTGTALTYGLELSI